MIAVAAGLDLYHPGLTFVIALVGGGLIPFIGKLLDKMKIDDVVGAVAVHGGMGLYSLIVAGIFLAGYPNTDGNPSISFWGGQLIGAAVFAALGFIPTYLLSLGAEEGGPAAHPAGGRAAGPGPLRGSRHPPYPEGIPVTAMKVNGSVLVVTEEVN